MALTSLRKQLSRTVSILVIVFVVIKESSKFVLGDPSYSLKTCALRRCVGVHLCLYEPLGALREPPHSVLV